MSNYSKEEAIKELDKMNFKYGNLANKYAELKAKFDKLVEDLKEVLGLNDNDEHWLSSFAVNNWLNELSSKQEGKE